MRILCVKASNIRDVRLQKFGRVFSESLGKPDFLGLKRFSDDPDDYRNFGDVEYVNAEGKSGIALILKMMTFLFFSTYHIYKNRKKYDYFYCADFEAAFPAYLASFLSNDIKIIYDVYDEFSDRYKIPRIASQIFISLFERPLRKKSYITIHVDEYRVKNFDLPEKTIIIQNSPIKGDSSEKYALSRSSNIENRPYVATGYLAEGRGVSSIYNFFRKHSDLQLIVYGRFTDERWRAKYAELSNVELHDFIPQEQLLPKISGCRAIFSLYDPTVEINRLAASNKLYDAMFLGVPVITNLGIKAADFVLSHNIGFVVNYEYDDSWENSLIGDGNDFSMKGERGHQLFIEKYDFSSLSRALIKRMK
ncbi:hypothetical protein [Idiomarina sp.]|uniref:hypothetical protein n=1 Tax=Idiomarina sp. TaxID=1874361 RepID=UPI002583E02D|nr:hypothetical protein [Idiomarina sp.]